MNARERFERTRKAVERLEYVQALIMSGCDDWRPDSVRKSNSTSDPTAARAIRNVDVLAGKLEALHKEESELLDEIGETLRIIQGVRDSFGVAYGNLLEWRYVDRMTWAKISDLYGIPKSTGHHMLGIVFDWIDSVGISGLLHGDTEL